MEKVFIAGPLKIRSLDKNIKERLDNIIQKKIEVLVGDANGIDKAVQEYLFSRNYRNATVYCINKPRNNVGNWNIKSIPCGDTTILFSEYVKKDLAMAKDTDFGFMIWNGKSNGTLNNTLNLLESGKKTRLYLKPAGVFYTIIKLKDLEELLSNCDKEDLNIIDRKIKLFERIQILSQGNLFENADNNFRKEDHDYQLLAEGKGHYGVDDI